MAEDLQTRAQRALSGAEEIRDQMDKLASLEGSGDVTAEVVSEIRDELGGKAQNIQQDCIELVDEIQKQLSSLREEMAAKGREREVIEAKHKIGAIKEEKYKERIAGLDPELKKIESGALDLEDLAEKLRSASSLDPEKIEKPGEVSREIKSKPAEKKTTTPLEGSRLCGGCGAENRSGATFCKNCGLRLMDQTKARETIKEDHEEAKTPRKANGTYEAVSGERCRPRRVLFLGLHDGRIIGEKVSGFDDVFDHLTKRGVEVKYEVSRRKGPYTPVDPGYLEKFGAVFVLGSHNDRFDSGKILQEGEVGVLRDFVAAGGGLLVTPCIYGSGFNYLEVKDGLSQLCAGLGVRFPVDHGDLIDPGKRVQSSGAHYPGKKDDWALIEAGEHHLTEGLEKIAFGPHGGAFLSLEETEDPLLRGVEVVLKTGKDQQPPGAPVMVLSKYGEGKAIVFGSPTAFMFPEFFGSNLVQNAELLERVTEYLLD